MNHVIDVYLRCTRCTRCTIVVYLVYHMCIPGNVINYYIYIYTWYTGVAAV